MCDARNLYISRALAKFKLEIKAKCTRFSGFLNHMANPLTYYRAVEGVPHLDLCCYVKNGRSSTKDLHDS